MKKTYNRVSKEAVCQAVGMQDVGGKLLNGIKSMRFLELLMM